MAKKESKNDDKNKGYFIPAGIFLGLGAGFLINDIAAGLFIGMGVGFTLMAISSFHKK